MSHKTGKRVLTASTSLALAVVGLAASPLAAHAVALTTGQTTWANGCGTNDTITVAAVDNLTRMSLDGTNWVSLPVKGYTGDGDPIIDLSGVTGLYDTNAASATYQKVIKDVYFTTATGSTTVTALASDGRTALVDNKTCTVTVGTSANDLIPTTGDVTGVVVAPTAAAGPAGTTGGTITLTKTAGVKWTVNDGKSVQVIESKNMGPTQAVTVSGANVTVTATAEDASGTTMVSTNNMTWQFTLNGAVSIVTAQPVSATYTAADQTVTVVNAAGVGNHWRWYITDSTVTDPATAKQTPPLAETGTKFQMTAADAGKTKKVWAIPDQGYQFQDGSMYKVFDVAVPAGLGVVIDPKQFTYVDNQGTSNDTVTAPAVSGAKLYYKFGATGSEPTDFAANPDGTLTSAAVTAGWKSLTAGTTTTVADHTDGQVMFIAAAATTPTGTIAYNPDLVDSTDFTTAMVATDTWKAAGFVSPAYTTGTPAVVNYPVFTDASGPADSVTFPAPAAGVTWALTVAPAGGATATVDPDYVNAHLGETFTRNQWSNLVTDDGVAGTLGTAKALTNVNQDVTFTFTPSATSGYAIPASVDSTRLKGTLSMSANAAAAEPVWIDNSGTTAQDFIKFSATPGVTYTYDVDADSNGIYESTGNAVAIPASGILVVPVAPGARVRVIATATSGTVLSNADPGTNGSKVTWVHQFTTGNTGLVPAAPTSNDPAGTDNDTYTIPSSYGIDYYVNGAKTAAGTYSTNGASKVSITAQPQAGQTIAQGATASWLLPFEGGVALGDVAVGNTIITDASVPTAKFTWSAENATSYTVTYKKVLGNGTYGPEMAWLTDTTETSANFVAMAGDEYLIQVTATNDNGDTKSATSGVKFPGGDLVDITVGNGTFNSAWQQLVNMNDLPYFGRTAALGFQNAEWTVTIPAGKTRFDLYATVFNLGAHGKIQVNGVNWADFDTNSSIWGTVSDPYTYPVRSIGGWDSSKPVTIKVIATDAGTKYLALDAYQAR